MVKSCTTPVLKAVAPRVGIGPAGLVVPLDSYFIARMGKIIKHFAIILTNVK
jgi:hypothetical protein